VKQFTFNGRSQSLAAWSRELGIPENTLRSRIVKLGLPVEEAFTRPVDTRFKPTRKPTPVEAPRPVPALQQDERNRAVARWVRDGVQRKKVFGVWGSAAAVSAYRRWAAEWVLGDEVTRELSVAKLAMSYFDFAQRTYVKHGRFTSEVHLVRAALATLVELYGDIPAVEFGPRQLSACQASWVQRGRSRSTCNSYVHRITRAFSWAVGESMLPAKTADALKHVRGIKRGRGIDREPIKPASAADAGLMLPHLHSDPSRRDLLQAIVKILSLTGARPGEILQMRPIDLDTSQATWSYIPSSGGKTLHLGKARKLFFGPRVREILDPFLVGCKPDQLVFRMASRDKFVPIRIEFLRHRMAAACRAAGVGVITPYQLRHGFATSLHRQYEDSAVVAAALGNTPAVAAAVYIESPKDQVAKRIAEQLG
jgi:integrase